MGTAVRGPVLYKNRGVGANGYRSVIVNLTSRRSLMIYEVRTYTVKPGSVP